MKTMSQAQLGMAMLMLDADRNSPGMKAAIEHLKTGVSQVQAANKNDITRQRVSSAVKSIKDAYSRGVELFNLFRRRPLAALDNKEKFQAALLVTAGSHQTKSLLASRDVLIGGLSVSVAAERYQLAQSTVRNAVKQIEQRTVESEQIYSEILKILFAHSENKLLVS